MSKLRQQIESVEGDLASPAERDLEGYAIFTQLKAGGPHLYAGWLDACDDEMALQFAREHYGQDQECVHIWAIPRRTIASSDGELRPAEGDAPGGRFQVFRQPKPGDGMVSTTVVDAPGWEQALEIAARREAETGPFHHLWVVPVDGIAGTDPGDLIWRFSDQTYRLARGYSRDVREKWERIRAERDLVEYEKDDLEETF